MDRAPQTWHHGLIAKWWSEFNDDFRPHEVPYFRRSIERDGQPALDVACGTGRLLLPYLRAGLDVDGCDVSADMIELCREKAASEGLSPTLFVQAMVELDPLAQHVTLAMHAEQWREGTLESEEDRVLTISLYFRNELLLMLELAGFANVTVEGDHNDSEATSDDDFLVFVARKQ